MMRFKVPFVKMQGLGNDFVVLYAKDFPENFQLDVHVIQHLGDRHFGIGFDQLIWIAPETSTTSLTIENTKNHFKVRFFNQDGSEALQCGNGLRCAARYIVEKKLSSDFAIQITTGAGTYPIKVEENFQQVAVNMGEPILTLENIPFLPEFAKFKAPFYEIQCSDMSNLSVLLYPLSMGNPHGVIFVENVDAIELDKIGNLLSHHPCFPEFANIEFVQQLAEDHLKIRIYERGVGETLACGSGACASMAAARMLKYVQEKVVIAMPGGELLVKWQGLGTDLLMSGPASIVFEGTFFLS